MEVWVSKDGDCYHRKHPLIDALKCRPCNDGAKKMKEKEALSENYSPCSICFDIPRSGSEGEKS